MQAEDVEEGGGAVVLVADGGLGLAGAGVVPGADDEGVVVEGGLVGGGDVVGVVGEGAGLVAVEGAGEDEDRKVDRWRPGRG